MFDIAVRLVRNGRAGESVAPLELLAGHADDFTVDDRTVGVPEYWLARAYLALGEPDRARDAVAVAQRVRPGELAIQALALRLRVTADEMPALADRWSPPGHDPVSVRLALADACRLVEDDRAAGLLLAPLAQAFPELIEAEPRRGTARAAVSSR